MPAGGEPPALRPLEALLGVTAALIGLLAVGPLLVEHLGLVGVVVSELVLVGLPCVGVLQARGLPVARALGIDRAAPSRVVGGALAGAGAFWLVALLEAGLLDKILPVPPAVKESLRRLVAPGRGWRFVVGDLVALALAPAVCEEALFRGLCLPSLVRTRLGAAGGVLATALLFAAFHLSVYRFVPTVLLGALLGVVRLASGSLWPAVAFHAVNNALVIALVRLGRDGPPSPSSVGGALALVAAVAALVAGLGLAARRAQRA